MSASRRTPRYVQTIGPEPMGPQRMGPHPMADAAPSPTAASAARSRETRGEMQGVLPMRPRLVEPEPAPAATAPLPSHTRRTRTRVVPVEKRPWRVLIVSTAPGAAPRSFEVPRWHARAAVGVLAVTFTLAAGFVAAVVVAVRTPDLFTESAEVGSLRAELAAAQDSLAVLRAVATSTTAAESGDVLPEGPAPVAVPTPPTERPKPLRPRASRARETSSESGLLASMPRSISDLPVIGALVSGFSRARRHPLLNVTRPHLGVDVAAPRGTRVSAPAPGRVRFVGRRIGFGLVVELDHGDGVTTRYAHLRSAAVEAGEQVTRGEAIAAVGTSGITTGPHLHYEVLVHGRQVDPLHYRFAGSELVPSAAPTATGNSMPAPSLPVAPGGAALGTHEGLAPAPR